MSEFSSTQANHSQSNPFTLRDLDYALAVAELKSFSKAAEACLVSQPALSKQIQTLEKALGIKLFERSKRQVMLTPSGQRFIEQAKHVKEEANKLLSISQLNLAPLSGPFRLGMIASCCPYLLPHFIAPLQQAYPELKLLIKEGLTDNLIEDLKQGRLDAVIAATTFEEPRVNNHPLFFEPFVLAEANGVASKSTTTKIKTEEIIPERLLLLEDGHCLKDQTLSLCALNPSSPSLNFRATSLETLLQMTAGGMGVAVVPILAAERHQNDAKTIQFKHFESSKTRGETGRTMALFYRKGYPKAQDLSLLAECIKSHLPDSVRILL